MIVPFCHHTLMELTEKDMKKLNVKIYEIKISALNFEYCFLLVWFWYLPDVHHKHQSHWTSLCHTCLENLQRDKTDEDQLSQNKLQQILWQCDCTEFLFSLLQEILHSNNIFWNVFDKKKLAQTWKYETFSFVTPPHL